MGRVNPIELLANVGIPSKPMHSAAELLDTSITSLFTPGCLDNCPLVRLALREFHEQAEPNIYEQRTNPNGEVKMRVAMRYAEIKAEAETRLSEIASGCTHKREGLAE